MSAADGTPYRRTSTGAEQTAADCTLRRVVGVRTRRQRQDQTHGDPAGGD
jgi:hypothetical protein